MHFSKWSTFVSDLFPASPLRAITPFIIAFIIVVIVPPNICLLLTSSFFFCYTFLKI
jgi:hypothetical protein